MSPLDKDIIRRKLALMIENLNSLKPIKNLRKDEYIEDVYKRKATERLLQELVEAAIDINTHLIVQTGLVGSKLTPHAIRLYQRIQVRRLRFQGWFA